MSEPSPVPHIRSPPSTRHFAATFLEAQKVQYDKRSCAPPFCFLSSQHSADSASSALRFAEYKRNPKYGSDRYLTKTLHLQNLAADSQPSSIDSESQEEDFEAPDPPVQQCKRKDSKGRFGSLRKLSLKNLTSQNRMMRRAQSEAQVNLQPSPKKISSVPSLSSLKKAFLPLKFISKTRKKKQSPCFGCSISRGDPSILDNDGEIVWGHPFGGGSFCQPCTTTHRTCFSHKHSLPRMPDWLKDESNRTDWQLRLAAYYCCKDAGIQPITLVVITGHIQSFRYMAGLLGVPIRLT